MDLLAFERKLDQTIARKRMEIQEAIKKPLTVSRGTGRGDGNHEIMGSIKLGKFSKVIKSSHHPKP